MHFPNMGEHNMESESAHSERMGFLYDPPPLKQIAVKKLQDYISMLYKKFVGGDIYIKYTEKQLNDEIAICSNLEQYIAKTIPPGYANEITNALLQRLCNEVSSKVKEFLLKLKRLNNICSCQIPYHYPSPISLVSDTIENTICTYTMKTEYWCLERARRLANAIYHPSVTTLNFNTRFILLFDNHVSKLNSLRVLNLCVFDYTLHKDIVEFSPLSRGEYIKWRELSRHLLQKYLKAIPNVEEITFPGCVDEDLMIMSESCPNIRILNLKTSAIGDKCVKYIIKFNRLEKLIISETDMTDSGLKELCCSLTGNKRLLGSIIELSVGFVDVPINTSLLAESFPYLRSLTVHMPNNTDLNAFKELKFLKEISVISSTYFKFENLRGFLKDVGLHLVKVNLSFIDDIELDFLCQFLPHVTHLGLTVRTAEDLGFEGHLTLSQYKEKYPLAEFRSVKSLRFILCTQVGWDLFFYVLSLFKNLRELNTDLSVCIFRRRLVELMSEDSLNVLSMSNFPPLNIVIEGNMLYIRDHTNNPMKIKRQDYMKFLEGEDNMDNRVSNLQIED